jgi:hypothetical protein
MGVDVIRERLANQFLTGPALAGPVDVVRALGAVQAQDYYGAKWAVGMRTRSATDADVERAVATGAILRTHVLRPTWHFVLPEDIRWMLELTGPRVSATMGMHNPALGLTKAVLRKSRATIEKALASGEHLTRQELAAALNRARIDTSEMRLVRLVMQAEVDGVICSGARRGKQFTYALLDACAPSVPRIERDDALSRLARTYFTTRGPASIHDFAWWSGLRVSDAKRAVEILGQSLTAVKHGEKPLWMIERSKPAPSADGSAHLLPNYDEYFIGHRDRSAIGGRLSGVGLVTGGDASISHVIIAAGELVGRWKRVTAANRSQAEISVTGRVTRLERAAIARALARFDAFNNAG